MSVVEDRLDPSIALRNLPVVKQSELADQPSSTWLPNIARLSLQRIKRSLIDCNPV
jgi:hypothetical protein